MSLSVEFIFRIMGAIAGSIGGGYFGLWLSQLFGSQSEAFVVNILNGNLQLCAI